MFRFECDYTEGAHPRILEELVRTNLEQTAGYGEDAYCQRARELIKEKCNAPESDVYFLVGGTQTNATVISAVLRPHQGVVSASTGHINVHETGAVEATGHKVLPIPSADGKITAQQLDKLCRDHWEDPTYNHMVQPGMVYLSHPTENGTLYSKQELAGIRKICDKYDMPLFVDGARMGYGIMSEKSDLTLADMAEICDAFYIGGTKQGLLFGEALVISRESIKKDFNYIIKRHGGLLAKGRLLGIQFKTMLEDDLYFTLAKQADEYAMQIRRAFERKGIGMFYDSYTNQQFPVLTREQHEKLNESFASSYWGQTENGGIIVRFCTSWATERVAVEALVKAIDEL
ncbi:MAG: aminotransferase class I/II-fold pyridoxal phosphate-dependent enzyme [Clostridia bacterium]|nr:aminotransferase class I/II-fold pyridoxal phosphate-dependent enzyme [Clostridia bacterium]